jgi:hypothetical protein
MVNPPGSIVKQHGQQGQQNPKQAVNRVRNGWGGIETAVANRERKN